MGIVKPQVHACIFNQSRVKSNQQGAFSARLRLTHYETLDVLVGYARSVGGSFTPVCRRGLDHRRRRALAAGADAAAHHPAAAAAPVPAAPPAPLRPAGRQLRQGPHPHHRPGRRDLRGPGVLQPESGAAGRHLRVPRSPRARTSTSSPWKSTASRSRPNCCPPTRRGGSTRTSSASSRTRPCSNTPGATCSRSASSPSSRTARSASRLSYTQLLKADDGLVSYVLPLNTEKFSAKPIKNVSVKVDLESKRPLKSIYSPSHTVEVKRRRREPGHRRLRGQRRPAGHRFRALLRAGEGRARRQPADPPHRAARTAISCCSPRPAWT